jgi:uncharacterized membrane protein YfcA
MTDWLHITFPVSGVTTWTFIPPLVAFAISFFTSMGGVSGAFMLMPFQMSVLHYTTPSVSGTNHLFNIIAIPSGVWRYVQEKRMVWPLTWAVIIGTLPGVLIGAWVRLRYLPDPRDFKLFVGLVLLYVGSRLCADTFRGKEAAGRDDPAERETEFMITEARFSLKQAEFRFGGQKHVFSLPGVFLLSLIVGIIGGVYGIGGGAIIAPFFVTFFHLPVHAVAGAALMGTLVTSMAGVLAYQVLASVYSGLSVAPDWYLGFLFGAGGFLGMYLGARCQRHVAAHAIKLILCFCVLFIACRYVYDFIK